jgi:hypothetical protein
VLLGPSVVLYGGSSPSGIVNAVSKMPPAEPIRYLETGVNNFGNSYLASAVRSRRLPKKIIWALLDVMTIVVIGSGLYLWWVRRRRMGRGRGAVALDPSLQPR